jgi:hypothetical protein
LVLTEIVAVFEDGDVLVLGAVRAEVEPTRHQRTFEQRRLLPHNARRDDVWVERQRHAVEVREAELECVRVSQQHLQSLNLHTHTDMQEVSSKTNHKKTYATAKTGRVKTAVKSLCYHEHIAGKPDLLLPVTALSVNDLDQTDDGLNERLLTHDTVAVGMEL